MADEDAKRPIIIIKKVDDEHDDHHGGVWKIAFADFMTAMMAFFLVMWLINAANEATKAQVASYFNPVKLTASSPAAKGVQTIKDKPSVEEEEVAEEGAEQGSKPNKSDGEEGEEEREAKSGGEGSGSDAALFSDPFTVLAEIAAEPAEAPAPADSGAEKPDTIGLKGGEAFRDPFGPPEPMLSQESEEDGEPAIAPNTTQKKAAGTASKENEPGKPDGQKKEAKKSKRDAEDAAEHDRAYDDLRKKILEAAQAVDEQIPGKIIVSRTVEGILVSLTDSFETEMFRSSSARPTPALVRLVDRLSPIIKERPEKIIVRGHTDARPFTSGSYDNWRLSTARAHVARYMLARGGIPDKRIVRIEGHAAQLLRDKNEPFAPENRRIEILILDDRT